MKRAQQAFKVLALLFVISCLVLAAPPTARAQDNPGNQDGQGDYSNVRIVRLSFVEGDVQYQQGDSDWQAAPMNLPLQEGFRLATGNGRAEIEFESGLIVRLADNSELDFTQLALLNGGRITQLTLVQGTIIATANPRTNDAVSILAPNIQVGAIRGARFRVDTAQGDTWVTTMKGEVTVNSAAGNSRVPSGRMLHISGVNPDQISFDKSADLDDFDRWAADRDQTLALENSQALQSLGGYASDYSDYNYGLAELSTYGNFVSLPGYGLCWSPFGISPGWLPFWNGAMVFFPATGWAWVSYEPWGWLPFHTGDWFFVPGRGWFWRCGPARFWNPAPVHWVRAGGHVGWTPRGVWNPNGPPGGPWIVTVGKGRPGELHPELRFRGLPGEVRGENPPPAPIPVARGPQTGPGAPANPFNGPVRGPIQRDPKFVARDDNPPTKPVRTAPGTEPRQFVGGPPARIAGPGGATDNPPSQPTIVVTPGVKTAPTTVQTSAQPQTPAPQTGTTPQTGPAPRFSPSNPATDDRPRTTPPTTPPITVQTPQQTQQPMQQPRYTPPPQQQAPVQQQQAPPQQRYTPPPQPQQQQQQPQQHYSPPPSPPVQHSSPPPSPPPAQHTSPPPAPPPHTDSGGGAKSSPPPSPPPSSSTPVHHR
jgi:hypothetical protein